MLDRPESWNAKMLSGEPLITDEQFEKLLANAPDDPNSFDEHDHINPVPVVKIFLPHVRWILAWIYPDDRDRAFGVVKYGNEEPELCDVLLSDVVQSRLVFGDGDDGLRPERDKYISLDQPISHYLQDRSDW